MFKIYKQELLKKHEERIARYVIEDGEVQETQHDQRAEIEWDDPLMKLLLLQVKDGEKQ